MGSPSEASESPRRAPGRTFVRGLWIVTSVVVFLLSSAYFFLVRIEPSHDPYQSPSLFSPDFWLSPVEINAPRRLVHVNQALYGLFVRDGGREVWTVGDQCTILHTADGGRTWEEQKAPDVLRAEAPTPPPLPVPPMEPAVPAAPEPLREAPPAKGPGPLPPDDLKQLGPAADKAAARADRAGNVSLAAYQGAVESDPSEKVRPPAASAGGASSAVDVQPEPAKKARRHSLSSVYFMDDGKTGWIGGDYGLLLKTVDGGATWTEIETRFVEVSAEGTNAAISGDTPRSSTKISVFGGLNRLHFWDVSRGMCVANTELFVTTDGGVVWTQSQTPLRWVDDAHAATDGQIWISGQLSSAPTESSPSGYRVLRSQAVARSNDFGRTWTSLGVVSGTSLASDEVFPFVRTALCSSDRQRAWVVCEEEIIPSESGASVGASPPRTSRLQILRTDDGGGRWETCFSAAGPMYVWSVTTSDPEHVWAGGWQQPSGMVHDEFGVPTNPGRILHTADGGSTWTTQLGDQDVPLIGPVKFTSPTRGWAVGQGLILKTTDGGTTWQRMSRDWRKPALADTPYVWLPAPAYYVLLLVACLLLIPAFFATEKAGKKVTTEEAVAERFASDRPLRKEDRDYLGFRTLALALSKFLRNENTVPPVTIAVTGDWGTGKSSLLNLVFEDLRKHFFQPVWFNAWHHQKEEQLLAALLENVQAQAVPRWTDPITAIRFRLRLLLRKGWRYLWWIPVLAALTGALGRVPAARQLVDLFTSPEKLGALFSQSGGERMPSEAERPAPPRSASGENPASVESPRTAGGDAAQWLRWGGILGAIAVLWRGMTAFGVNPAALMVKVSGAAKIQNLSAQVSFRHQFAREFGDVTWALAPRRLVILIDDLDRCRPENVLDALEAVNFLVTSGDCFVVLGMALSRVQRCVGLGFKDVAEELLEDGDGPREGEDAQQHARRRRVEFAKQYLEKLINIEVPIPEMGEAQAVRLLRSDDGTPPAEREPLPPLLTLAARRVRTAWNKLPMGAQVLLVLVAVACPFTAGFYSGSTSPQSRDSQPQPGAASNGRQAPTTAEVEARTEALDLRMRTLQRALDIQTEILKRLIDKTKEEPTPTPTPAPPAPVVDPKA